MHTDTAQLTGRSKSKHKKAHGKIKRQTITT